MKRFHAAEYESLIHAARGLIGYLCLIILFGGVILIVQAAMEVKRIRYQMTDAYIEKIRLLDELRIIDNRIAELERYSLIAERISATLPYLGPPRHPAIELEVPGLQTRTGPPEAPLDLLADRSTLAWMRNGWHTMRQNVRDWLRSLIE